MNASNIHEDGTRKLLFRFLFSITVLLMTVPAEAVKPETNAPPGQEANVLNLKGGFVTNMGFVAAGDLGMEFTNAGIRTMAVSIGQLGGVNPETGEIIINEGNLLPMVTKDLDVTGKAFFYTNIYIAADTYVYGAFYGSGAGITNLPVQNISGSLFSHPDIQYMQHIIDSLNASVTATNNPHQVTAAQTGALPLTGGKVTGNIDLNDAARIINLPDPANDQDAVPKGYLDRRLQYIPPQGDIGMGTYTNAPGY